MTHWNSDKIRRYCNYINKIESIKFQLSHVMAKKDLDWTLKIDE